jgi:PAS domain S-box-containing protein
MKMAKKFKFNFANKFQIIILLVILSLVIATAGYFFYRYEEKAIRQEEYHKLKAIADLKEGQINEWVKDRKADAITGSKSPSFIKEVNQWLKDTANVQLKEDIKERLCLIQKEHEYENIFLIAPEGHNLISAITESDEFDYLTKQKITEACQKGEITFTDFYFCKKHNKIHYDMIAPIILGENNTIAVLLFRRDPNMFLYPLIKNWPTPSQSSETAILRVENDSVVFLNELRHRKNTALKLKLPLTRTNIPAVQAALGRTGITEGIDYRGVKVLADIRVIPVTNWIMLSKIDKSEVFASLYLSAGIISGFSILIIIFCSVGIAFIYKSRQNNIIQELYNKEKELWLKEERFKVTIDSLGDGVITTDINGNILYLNIRAEELTGWNNREARGRALSDVYYVRNEETGLIESNILEKVIRHGIVKELANHTILISRSGQEIAVTDTGAPIFDIDGSAIGVVITFQDETEKRKQQRLIKESEARLNEAQKIAKLGNWELDIQTNIPVWSLETYRIHELDPSVQPDVEGAINFYAPEVRPIITEALNCCIEDGKPWDLELPFITAKGKNIWVRAIGDAEFHDGKCMRLFGTLQDITERKKAEINLQVEHDKAVQYFETASVIMLILDNEGNVSKINIKGCEVLGYSKEEIIGKNWFDNFLPKNNIEEIKNIFKKLSSGENEPLEFYENPVLNVKAEERIIAWHSALLKDANGEIIGVLSSGEDITVRKQAEDKLLESQELFKKTLELGVVGMATTHPYTYYFLSANQHLCKMLGYTEEELLQKTWVEITFPKEKVDEDSNNLEKLLSGELNGYVMEKQYQHKDGHMIDIILSVQGVRKKDGTIDYILILINDISDHKKAEKELNKLNRIYTVLSNINQTIVRVKDKQTIYDEACRIAVEDGKFRMSWIGLVDEQTNTFLPVATSGFAQEYVQTFNIDLNDKILSDCPIGRTIKTGVHYIANNIANDPEMIHWHENALKLGYKSSAAFPINVLGKTIGAFLIYSEELFFFNEAEVSLLDEMANDISFAIEFIDNETNRKQSESKLQESNQRFNRLVAEMNDVVWTANIDGSKIMEINQSFEKVYGITLEEFKTNPELWIEMVHPEDRKIAEDSGKELLDKGRASFEYRIIKPDGSICWLMDRKSIIYDSDGKPIQIGGIASDITERKKAEEEKNKLTSLVKHSKELVNLADLDGTMIFINEFGSKMIGVSPEEVRNINIMQVISDKSRDVVQNEVIPALFNTGIWQGELQYINIKTNVLTDVFATTFTIKDEKTGAPLFLANVSLDITERKRAEEEITKLNNLNKEVLNNAGEGIYGLDTNGVSTFVNQSAARMLGYEEYELVNIPMHTNHHYKKVDGTEYLREDCPIYGAFKEGKTNHRDDEVFWRKDGTSFPVEYTSTPMIADGVIKGAVVVFKDITERKLAEEEIRKKEEYLRFVMYATNDIIYDWNLISNNIDWNNKLHENLGYPTELTTTDIQWWEDKIHPDDFAEMKESIQEVFDKKLTFWNEEYRFKRFDVSFAYVYDRGILIYDEYKNPVRWVGSVMDITKSKLAERELLISKEKAEESDKLKTAFLANMSHEIRTPMIGIIGFSRILTESNLTKSERKEYAEEMHKSSNRLLGLLNDIIFASQLETGNIESENREFNLNYLIEELYSDHLDKANTKDIEINASIGLSDEESEITNDEEKIQKIFSILLDNSLKFTDSGSITFGYKTMPNDCELFVKDTGIGISEEFLPKIFDLFSQENIALNRAHEGAGIGLMIAKRLVELLGGRIWVESQKGVGTTVYFTITKDKVLE